MAKYRNFNDDRWLTSNSLILLQPSGGGDDKGFYRRDGILVLGIDSFAFGTSEAIDLGDGGTILKV
jgi:hypothetical protein